MCPASQGEINKAYNEGFWHATKWWVAIFLVWLGAIYYGIYIR